MRDLPQIIDYDKDQLSYALANALQERDKARDIAEKLSKQGLDMMDENKSLKRQRDEAMDAIIGWENKWKYAVEIAARAELERDYALDKLNDLKNILR